MIGQVGTLFCRNPRYVAVVAILSISCAISACSDIKKGQWLGPADAHEGDADVVEIVDVVDVADSAADADRDSSPADTHGNDVPDGDHDTVEPLDADVMTDADIPVDPDVIDDADAINPTDADVTADTDISEIVIQCGVDGMCLVPAGSFWMGCNLAVDSNCGSDESPYHEVTLSGYYVDRTEVTVSKYTECVDTGDCTEPATGEYCNWKVSGRENRPVNCVTWAQTSEYCIWAGKRLPTEAEWEKAARGSDGRRYPWGNQAATCDYAVMDDLTHISGCGTKTTWQVCSKSPAGDSPYGLCDMAGNVWEWVADWYGVNYYGVSPDTDPTGPLDGTTRGIRGGSYFYEATYYHRTSSRYNAAPAFDGDGLVGFRCARSQ